MKKVAKSRRVAAATALEQHRHALDELALRFAGVATSLGASAYCLFLVEPATTPCKLVAVFDFDFPRISATTRRLSGVKPIADHRLRTSTRPFWWTTAGNSDKPALSLAEQVNVLGLRGSGLALPLHAGPRQNGLAVFSGKVDHLSDDTLLENHLACMQLFGALSELSGATPGAVPTMSNRELDCLRLTADGRTSDEIARSLGLSRHTADQYLTAAAHKLNAVNRTHAVSKALRSGLIR